MGSNDCEHEEEIEMRNRQCVLNALVFLKNEVTADELLDCFIASNHEPHNVVRQELKRILRNGVVNGYIERNGNKYALPSLQTMYETDCDDAP